MGMFNFKKKFKASLLKPVKGQIWGMFFSNPLIGIETSFFYQMSIELEPFEYDGETENTEIMLDFISMPARSYSELNNHTFTFPVNPEKGYIDGSIYISTMHNPFSVTEIHFYQANKTCISARLKGTLYFEDESIEPTELSFESQLVYDDIIIHCDKLKSLNDDQLMENIKKMIDLQYYSYDPASKHFKWKPVS
jgi:hypothetical protein